MILLLSIIINLGILFVFKYLVFVCSNIAWLFNKSCNLQIVLGKVKVQRNIFYLGLYILFFPQFVAGPIVRYETVEKQMKDRRESWDAFFKDILIWQ
ncbi:hypothetical protein BEI60_15480 [Eisenbergiella tayi]|nr:hypothetical protein BEI60_15480 [Eisenbergiella tayi]